MCKRVSVHSYVYICLWGTQTERQVPGVNSGQSLPGFLPGAEYKDPETPAPLHAPLMHW